MYLPQIMISAFPNIRDNSVQASGTVTCLEQVHRVKICGTGTECDNTGNSIAENPNEFIKKSVSPYFYLTERRARQGTHTYIKYS